MSFILLLKLFQLWSLGGLSVLASVSFDIPPFSSRGKVDDRRREESLKWCYQVGEGMRFRTMMVMVKALTLNRGLGSQLYS